MRCTKCRHMFVVHGGGQVVPESGLDQTTRPAFDGELDGVIDRARGAAAAAPPPKPQPPKDIDDILGNISIPPLADSPFADPQRVLNTLEDAVIKPKMPTPVTDMDMPRPSDSVRRSINEDTYSRRRPQPPATVSSDDDWNHYDDNGPEVNINDLQQRIDHITNVSRRPQPDHPVPGTTNTATFRGPDPMAPTEWKTSGETVRYGTTTTARRGLAGRPGLADAPPSLGGRERSTGRRRNPADPPGVPGLSNAESTTARRRSELLDPIMSPPPSSGNTGIGRRPAQRKSGIDIDDLNATPSSGPGMGKTRPTIYPGDSLNPGDNEYTPVRTMKNNTLQKLLVFVIILIALLIGLTAAKMGDRFDITKLTPQIVMYEVFGVGTKPGSVPEVPEVPDYHNSDGSPAEDPLDNLL